ncbi:MAG: hypothetical protein HQL79_02980 [Magnetococcales bacterium]|nr:hypothetical protein [Magnetococcales bacterium]
MAHPMRLPPERAGRKGWCRWLGGGHGNGGYCRCRHNKRFFLWHGMDDPAKTLWISGGKVPESGPSDTARALVSLVDKSAEMVRGVFLTFMLVSVYLAILIGSTTHKQLLLESGVPLPLLQTNLPIVWVYATVPWIYFVLHWNLLQLLHVHACKLHKIKEHLSGRQILHHLFPLPYSLWQTHAHANGLFHGLFALFVHVSTVLLPLGLLLWMQIRFLPYHNQEITWWCHRLSRFFEIRRWSAPSPRNQ